MVEIASERYMTDDQAAMQLTRTELAVIRCIEAFARWSEFLHKSVAGTSLGHQDVWLLHSIRMRGGAQNLSELLLFLNRNDVSSIQYSLKKLEQFGYVKRIVGNSKREAGYELTPEGLETTEHYARVRQEVLIQLVDEISSLEPALARTAQTLERLTGIYDQVTQTVLNRHILSGESSARYVRRAKE